MEPISAGPAGALEYRECHIRFLPRLVPVDDQEPSRFIQRWSGRIEAERPAETVIVGAFTAYFVDVLGADLEGASPMDVFDTHQGSFAAFEKLFESEAFEMRADVEELAFHDEFSALEGVLIVDQLVVLPAHRGHDVGLIALKALIEQFRARATVAVLKTVPLQLDAAASSQDPEMPRADLLLDSFSRSARIAESKLKQHFGRLGFAPVPHTSYMVLDPARRMPSYDVLRQNPRREGRPTPAEGGARLKAVSKPKPSE